MIVIASVIAAVLVAIITSIPVIVAMIGPAITVITSIRSAVTVVETLVTVLVVVVVALCLLGFRGYSKGTLQLLALHHGIFGVAVELALVVHDHVEVTFEVEGLGGSAM
jgi:Na+/serine symporter